MIDQREIIQLLFMYDSKLFGEYCKKHCNCVDERELDVRNSSVKFLCLSFDKRFGDRLELVELFPYTYTDPHSLQVSFAWVDESGNLYANEFNPVCDWEDRIVIAFREILWCQTK